MTVVLPISFPSRPKVFIQTSKSLLKLAALVRIKKAFFLRHS